MQSDLAPQKSDLYFLNLPTRLLVISLYASVSRAIFYVYCMKIASNQGQFLTSNMCLEMG